MTALIRAHHNATYMVKSVVIRWQDPCARDELSFGRSSQDVDRIRVAAVDLGIGASLLHHKDIRAQAEQVVQLKHAQFIEALCDPLDVHAATGIKVPVVM